jgi:hypothetical protein
MDKSANWQISKPANWQINKSAMGASVFQCPTVYHDLAF